MLRRNFNPGHDRGRVLTDVALKLADGREAIADIDVLRHQAGVLGPVASGPGRGHVWSVEEEALSRGRDMDRHVWAQRAGGVPASKVAGTDLDDVIVLDTDATIVISHSEKENAAATSKRT